MRWCETIALCVYSRRMRRKVCHVVARPNRTSKQLVLADKTLFCVLWKFPTLRSVKIKHRPIRATVKSFCTYCWGHWESGMFLLGGLLFYIVFQLVPSVCVTAGQVVLVGFPMLPLLNEQLTPNNWRPSFLSHSAGSALLCSSKLQRIFVSVRNRDSSLILLPVLGVAVLLWGIPCWSCVLDTMRMGASTETHGPRNQQNNIYARSTIDIRYMI